MGFLIDAVAHRIGRTSVDTTMRYIQMYIWLRFIVHTCKQRSLYAGLSLMVWILKREVRAFGGCLGMYRR